MLKNDLLNLDLDGLKPYVIGAFTHVYGSNYHEIIANRINKAMYFTYIDIEGLKNYIKKSLEYKKYKLVLSFFEQIGYDVEKYKNLNLDELAQEKNLDKLLKIYFGFFNNIFEEEKYNNLFCTIRLFNLNNIRIDKEKGSTFKRKLKLINFLRDGNEEINEDNYSDFINTKECSILLDRIKEYNDIYDKLKQEFIQYKSSFSRYEKYIENDKIKKNAIFKKGMDYIYNELLSSIKPDLKKKLEELPREKIYELFFDNTWNSELKCTSLIEAFDKKYMDDLYSSEESLFTKSVLASYQIEYLRIFNIEMPIEKLNKHGFSYFHTKQDVLNYLNFLKSDEVQNLIPQQDLIDKFKELCKENYEIYEKRYYTNRMDFFNILTKLNSNQDLDDWLIDKIKSKSICITMGGANNINGYVSVMFYTVNNDTYGFLDRAFIHENGHIIDDSPNGCGFELLDDCNSKEYNKYDNSYRKYEKFNETINDMFVSEAIIYLHQKGIHLLEEKEHANNNWQEYFDTGFIEKLLRPLIERYRSIVIEAKINVDRKILSSYIGEDNFEELVDVINKVDYLWNRGLDYKLKNDKDNADVIEYYRELERAKEIYINIDAFVANNYEVMSVKK